MSTFKIGDHVRVVNSAKINTDAEALDRIAELVKKAQADYYYRGATLAVFAALADDVATVVRETGRLS